MPGLTTGKIWEVEDVDIHSLQERMEEKFDDYHVLCFSGYGSLKINQLDIELKVFNHENISDVNFEELRSIIKENLDASIRTR